MNESTDDEKSAVQARMAAALRAKPARERCQEVFGDGDLVTACMAIKMGLSGASDWPGFPADLHPDRPDKDWARDLSTCRDTLNARLDTWMPSTFAREHAFDMAVFAMVAATVKLIDRELREHALRVVKKIAPLRLQVDREAVQRIGEAIGYGQLMQIASQEWSAICKAQGHPGGEFSVGPCTSQVEASGAHDCFELLAAWESLSDEAREAALATIRTRADAGGP